MTEKKLTNPNGVIRPVQIIPSVLPADWANMGACVKELEEAGVDRIQFDVILSTPASSSSFTHAPIFAQSAGKTEGII